MGSFWDAPLQNSEQADLLQREEMDLLQDIMRLPQQLCNAAYQRTSEESAKCESTCLYYSLFAQTTSVHVGKKGETETTDWTT
jgi:hypothetical protein